MFRINIRVRYRGRLWTAIGYDHATRRYQLRGRRGELAFAAESELSVVSGR